MIINEEGTYTLRYTATDDCGKTTTVDRELVVEGPKRTVLYSDGTFIINERQSDISSNVALHGDATNIYEPLDATHDYVFANNADRPWHDQRSVIKNVEIGSTIHPTSTQRWFNGFSACETVNLTNIETQNTTSMSSMFYHCISLTNILGLNTLDTSNVTDMNTMFYDCTSLQAIDLTSFNTQSVQNMNQMFCNCSSLTSIDVSGFNTENVTDISQMFQGCSSLTSIDISGFDTRSVTNMGSLFNGCSNLLSVDLGQIDTSNVTTMRLMFESCGKLEVIDVSSFNTLNVTNMTQMFSRCVLLKTIYASPQFTVAGVSSDTLMFGNMSSNLVGGAGTTWSSSHTNKGYARIDGGTSNPGYFTAKS